MAWNPSKEVAVARDAAKRLDDADQAIVIWINQRTEKVGMASYGRNKALCDEAGKLVDELFRRAMEWFEEQ